MGLVSDQFYRGKTTLAANTITVNVTIFSERPPHLQILTSPPVVRMDSCAPKLVHSMFMPR